MSLPCIKFGSKYSPGKLVRDDKGFITYKVFFVFYDLTTDNKVDHDSPCIGVDIISSQIVDGKRRYSVALDYSEEMRIYNITFGLDLSVERMWCSGRNFGTVESSKDPYKEDVAKFLSGNPDVKFKENYDEGFWTRPLE